MGDICDKMVPGSEKQKSKSTFKKGSHVGLSGNIETNAIFRFDQQTPSHPVVDVCHFAARHYLIYRRYHCYCAVQRGAFLYVLSPASRGHEYGNNTRPALSAAARHISLRCNHHFAGPPLLWLRDCHRDIHPYARIWLALSLSWFTYSRLHRCHYDFRLGYHSCASV